MEWNYEGFMDEYGLPVFDTPDNEVYGPHNDLIDTGVIDHWQNEADGFIDSFQELKNMRLEMKLITVYLI